MARAGVLVVALPLVFALALCDASTGGASEDMHLVLAQLSHKAEAGDESEGAQAALLYLQNHVQEEQHEDDARTNPSIADLEERIETLGASRAALMAEVENLEETLRGAKHVTSSLPTTLQAFDTVATALRQRDAVVADACRLATARHTAHLATLATLNTTATTASALLSAHHPTTPVLADVATGLNAVVDQVNEDVAAGRVELEEQECLCRKLADRTATSRNANTTEAAALTHDTRMLRAAQDTVARTQALVAPKLVHAGVLESAIEDAEHTLASITRAADERRAHRENTLQRIAALRDLLVAVEDPEGSAKLAKSLAVPHSGARAPAQGGDNPVAIASTRETALPTCQAIKQQCPLGCHSGVYWIHLGTPASPLQAYCDMETDGGGWTMAWVGAPPPPAALSTAAGSASDGDDAAVWSGLKDVVFPIGERPSERPETQEDKLEAARVAVESQQAAQAPSTQQQQQQSQQDQQQPQQQQQQQQEEPEVQQEAPANEANEGIAADESAPPPSATNADVDDAVAVAAPSAQGPSLDSLGFAVPNLDCVGSDHDKVCLTTAIEQCIALCALDTACTHWTYNYNTSDTLRFSALNETVWTDGCCWLKTGEPVCASPELVVGKVSGAAERAGSGEADMAKAKTNAVFPSAARHMLLMLDSDGEGSTGAGVALQVRHAAATGLGAGYPSANSRVYRYFATRPHQEALKEMAVVFRGSVVERQQLKLRFNEATLHHVMQTPLEASCLLLNSSVQVFGPRVRAPGAATDRSGSGCCADPSYRPPFVDHPMGGTAWVRSVPSVEGGRFLGLATDVQSSEACGVPRPDQCSPASDLVCDFSPLSRLVAHQEGFVAPVLTHEGADSVVGDVFSSKALYATDAPPPPGTAQAFSWAFRAQPCPRSPLAGVCSGHGMCEEGSCDCFAGWSGAACGVPVCPGGCGSGECKGPSQCQCLPGFTGDVCDKRVSCDTPAANEDDDDATGVESVQCSGAHVGSVCRFTCEDGKTVKGSPGATLVSRVCMGDGQWSGTAPSCVATACPALPPIPNARVVCTDTSVGASCSLACTPGHNLAVNGSDAGASLTTRCTGSGWDVDVARVECARVSCGDPPQPQHARPHTCAGSRFGDVCETVCEEGFGSVGLMGLRFVCQANGQWSNEDAACVADA